MTVDVQVDAAAGLVVAVLEGPVRLEGLVEGIDRMVNDPGFHTGMDILVDMQRHVHQASSADMRGLAGALTSRSEYLKGTRLAAVVSKTVSYGMIRMLQTFVDGAPFQVGVFYSPEAAKEWLGLS